MSSTTYRIVVGITGGIAAYKAVSLIRSFVKDGHHVDVIATAAALEFVGRPTLEAISRNPVYVGLYDDVAQVRHVALGQQADVIVIAPATANTLAQIANGLAPDLLGNAVLARRSPLVVAPAMHTEMWNNPATRANIDTLINRGVHIVGPESGALTGSDEGIGRMSEPENIVLATYAVLQAGGALVDSDLSGKRILITGGGTREPLDPIRFIGNRSSGRQAVALATRAQARGAEVTLVAANIEVPIPENLRVHNVTTASELYDMVMSLASTQDIIIMAAAVADYRPVVLSNQKMKKEILGTSPTIELVQNPDVLAELSQSARPDQMIVGFAAETELDDDKLMEIARSKLQRKGCDALVVNRVSWDMGFGTERNDVTVLSRSGDILISTSGTKVSVADSILDTITR